MRATVMGIVLVEIAASACGSGPKPMPPEPEPVEPAETLEEDPPTDDADERVAPTPIALGLACVPTWEDPQGHRDVALARVGAELVLCANDDDVGPVACWSVDAASGKVTPRAADALPGIGVRVAGPCYRGLCFEQAPDDQTGYMPGIVVALHADGKRAAALTGSTVTVYDLAAKKPIASAPARTSNSPYDLWFVGETIYVAGTDAGPAAALFAQTIDGRPLGDSGDADFAEGIWGLYNGNAWPLDDQRMGVSADGLSELVISDGKKGKVVKTLARKVPKGACKASDQPEWYQDPESFDEESYSAACAAYIGQHYAPYVNVRLIADGAGYLGLDTTTLELVKLDGKLAQQGARVPIARCSP